MKLSEYNSKVQEIWFLNDVWEVKFIITIDVTAWKLHRDKYCDKNYFIKNFFNEFDSQRFDKII